MVNIRNKGFPSLLIVCILVIGVGWQTSHPATQKGDSKKPMHNQVEEAAKKAKNSKDEKAVRELADAVFDYAGGQMPASVSDGIKDRLVRAEMNYRKGKKGIREEDIVRTVNELADTMSAPAYAKTSKLQVKVMRVKLMGDHPSFIAQERDEKKKGLKKEVGDTINPEVSPLEGAFITMMMIQQKVLNEDWQKTPEEYAANLNTKRQKEVKSAAGGQELKGRLVARRAKNIEKVNEMMETINKGLGRLGVAGSLDLVDKSLDTLGIER
jgi:hypothetical protein